MEKTKFVSAFAAVMVAAFILIFGSSNTNAAGTGVRHLTDGSQAGANRLARLGPPARVEPAVKDTLIQDFKPVTLDDLQPEGILPVDAPVDFNGDGKTDFVVVRNTGGGSSGQLTWFYLPNGGGVSGSVNFGSNSDWILSEDFDGDNKDDITVWRPSTAVFYILQSSSFTVRIAQFGQANDIPVLADYDGDGKADPAVFRYNSPGTPSVWWFLGSLNNPSGNATAVPWGSFSDVPAPGDWDGDGKNDFGVYRNSGTGQLDFWRMLNNGTVLPVIGFGTTSDFYVPGDYDGDGKTDIATARRVGGQFQWQWISSINGSVNATNWGLATDFPVQGQYDSDGKTDIAIWRPGANPGDAAFWVHLSSTGGTLVQQWGLSGDFPAAAYNVY